MEKQATIKDIARRLGISHSTVSRALSHKASHLVKEETRNLVKQTADELDYSPNLMAQGFVTGKTGTLGLLTSQIAQETFGKQTEQLLKAADHARYQVIVDMNTHSKKRGADEQEGQIKQFISRGVDGLLVNTRDDKEESGRISSFVGRRLPVVTYHDRISDLCSVVLDHSSDFHNATNHLIKLGHERIGFVGSDWDIKDPLSDNARGYVQAMQEHNLDHKLIPSKGNSAEGGYRLGLELMNQYTAYVCRSDYTAIGLCRGLKEAGLQIPDDVGVIGNGNLAVGAYLTPPLTTMSTPYAEIAQSAMNLLIGQIDGNDSIQHITLRSQLIVRQSCGGNNASNGYS